MDRTTRQKIDKEREDLNNIINQLDLTDIQNTLPNKCMWDIFHDKPSVRPQIKSQKILKHRYHTKYLL